MTDYMELAQSKINVLRDEGFKLTKEILGYRYKMFLENGIFLYKKIKKE